MLKGMGYWAGMLAGVTCALACSAAAKEFDEGPTITDVSPTAGLPGATVTIAGANFTGANVMLTGPPPAAVTTTLPASSAQISPDGTKIVMTIPKGRAANGQTVTPGSNTITVTTSAGTAKADFTLLASTRVVVRPAITAVAPRRGRVDATVVLVGRHIGSALSVSLAGVKASFRAASGSKVVAKVPTHARTGYWSVKTTAGTALSTIRFVVIPSK